MLQTFTRVDIGMVDTSYLQFIMGLFEFDKTIMRLMI